MNKLTLSMKRLNIIVINLQRCVAATSCESDDVVIVVAYFNSDLTKRQIISPNVKHGKNVPFNLEQHVKKVEMNKVLDFLRFEIQRIYFIKK